MSKNNKHEGMEIILITKRKGISKKYENSEQAYKIFKEILNYEEYDLRDREHFWVMGIDNVGYIVCIYIVALGGNNQVNMTAAEMLDIAVALKAKKIVLAHNHPSGNVEPSENDILTTNMLYHACYPFGIEILDHLIIGIDKYSSFEEKQIMDYLRNDKKYKGYAEGLDDRIIEITKNLINMNFNIEDIIKATGFSKEDIERLK